MQEGMQEERVGAGATGEWLRRAGSGVSWRPDRRTAAVLVGALYAYYAVQSIRTIPTLLSELTGSCGGSGFSGYRCTVPDYVRNEAGVYLALPLAYLAVVTGAVTLMRHHGFGKVVMIAAIAVAASADLVGMLITVSTSQIGAGLGSTWPELVTVVWTLLLAGFVATLPAES
jgi:hypothetical protein